MRENCINTLTELFEVWVNLCNEHGYAVCIKSEDENKESIPICGRCGIKNDSGIVEIYY